MKLYLWQYLDQVSHNYHCEGGLVIVAKDRAHAKQLISEHNESERTSWDPDDTVVVSDADWQKAHVYELADDSKPALYVFPDAGCC